MSQNDIAELLRRGIEAAREGRKAEARSLFEQVTDLDENNEKAWFWLASVVETDEERRICLSNVVHINPSNERAKRALTQIEERLQEKKPAVSPNDEEVIAGVTRRQLVLIAGAGAAVVVVLLLIAVVVISGNNQREAERIAGLTSVAQAATDTQVARDVAATANADSTATADAVSVLATQTQLAIATPTRALATLPPTWTPTPQQESAEGALQEQEFPVPLGLSGNLAVWGGRDVLNTGYLDVGYYNLSFGNQYNRVGEELGTDVSLSFNGQRMVYTRYDNLLFTSTLEAVNLNGSQVESLVNRWASIPGAGVLEPMQPSYGPMGQSLVFVARPQEPEATHQVYLLNLNAAEGENPLRRLTNDTASYSHPTISPDGSRVAVVRVDPNQTNAVHDIVSIDINSGGLVPISNDGTSFLEAHPRWTPDGLQVIYAAATATEPNNHDIYIRTASATSTGQPIYRDAADDIYPVLSPDGRYIAFANNRNGAYDIYIYDQNDLQLYQLTNTPDVDEYPGDWAAQ